MNIREVRRTFCEVRHTYLDSYETKLLIAFIVRPITCPHLLHTGVEVGQMEPIKAEYQREEKGGNTKEEWGKYTKLVW